MAYEEEKEMKCPFCGDEIYLGLSKKKDWFYCENCEKELTRKEIEEKNHSQLTNLKDCGFKDIHKRGFII